MLLRVSLLFLVGCTWGQPIYFNPDFYAHDYQSMAIINEENKQVKCSDEEFNQFASLSKAKIKELAEIIKRARLPKDKETTKLIKQLEEISK